MSIVAKFFGSKEKSNAMKYSLVFLVAAAISLLPLRPGHAAVLTVDSGGLGSYTTIQSAVDAAADGDEIHVAAGTYFENVVFDNTTTPDNIKLYGGYEPSGWTRDITANVTVIDGGGADSTVTVVGVAGVEIDGFTIRNCAPSGIVAGVYIYGASPTVTYNIVESNGKHGVYVEGSASPLIEKNLIRSNTYHGIYCYSFGGAGTPHIYNNTIDSNKTGIDLYSFSPIVYNNIMSSNTEYGMSAQVFSSPVANYNCYWSNGFGDLNFIVHGARDIMADPEYKGGGDYGLQETPTVSICVDAGKDLGLAFNGHLPDLGAYESNATRSTPLPPQGLTASPLSGKAFLGWDANEEAAVTGYKISYGTVSGSYTDTVDVGNVTQAVIDSLTNDVKYYFVAKAYFDAVNISGNSAEKSATPSNGNAELTHYYWDTSFGEDCGECHFSQGGGNLLPTGYDYRYSTELCLSCHNNTGNARGRLIDQANSHPVMVNVTTGGNSLPTYGNVTGRYSNSMWNSLKGGDTVACQTCHNIMEKPESPGRVWELTEFAGIDSWKTYNLANGAWSYYDFADPVVYGSTSLVSAPTNIRDRRDYLLAGNMLQDYSPTAGTIKFYLAYFNYAYVTLNYPSLRVSNSENNMCLDCHTSYQTHQGANCMNCHEMHNYGNRLGVKPRVKTPNSGIRSVVFESNTSTGSFADGDNVYDGICEVCHTQTLYYTNTGTGFAAHTSTGVDYSGWNCVTCHPHSNGFSP